MQKFMLITSFMIRFNVLLTFISFFLLNLLIFSSNENKENIFNHGIFTFTIAEDVNIKKFAKKISVRKISRFYQFKKLKISSSMEKEKKDLIIKFYIILQRVQDLLNMHPKNLNNINIKLFTNLKKIKFRVRNVTHRDAFAYYCHKEKSIYINVKKCDEYIIAHEMAHAIISNFFLVKPPANTQEILAIYCDSHLKDNLDYVSRKIY